MGWGPGGAAGQTRLDRFLPGLGRREICGQRPWGTQAPIGPAGPVRGAGGARAQRTALRFDLRGSADFLQFQTHGGSARRAARSRGHDSPVAEAAAPVRPTGVLHQLHPFQARRRGARRPGRRGYQRPNHPEGLRAPCADSPLLQREVQMTSWHLSNNGAGASNNGPVQQMFGNRGAIRLSSWPMLKRINRIIVALSLIACARLASLPPNAADNGAINPPPSCQDWQALRKLPDQSRGRTAVLTRQIAQEND